MALLYHIYSSLMIDIFKLCHDLIPEKGTKECRDITLQSKTKNVGGRTKQCRDIIFNVATKMPLRPVFRDPQFQPQSVAHHLKIYK